MSIAQQSENVQYGYCLNLFALYLTHDRYLTNGVYFYYMAMIIMVNGKHPVKTPVLSKHSAFSFTLNPGVDEGLWGL